MSNYPIMEFDVNPMGKPRMTQRDKWAKRPVTIHYWAYKDELKRQAREKKFVMPIHDFHVIFYIPMSVSWSKKKKLEMEGKPHQDRPDVDNLIKGLFDCLLDQDCGIYDVRISKYWSETGWIEVYAI